LGIGDWGLGPIPNPQSPIPNPQSPFSFNIKRYNYIKFNKKCIKSKKNKNIYIKCPNILSTTLPVMDVP
jgi:hypothetical protein